MPVEIRRARPGGAVTVRLDVAVGGDLLATVSPGRYQWSLTAAGGVLEVPFAAGEMVRRRHIRTHDDTTAEADGSITVEVLPGDGYTPAGDHRAVIPVRDNDGLPAVGVRAAAAAVTEGAPARFTVSRSATEGALTVTVIVRAEGDFLADATLLGAALAAAGSSAGARVAVAFTAGQGARTLVLNTANDAAAEAHGRVLVAVAAADAYRIGAPGEASIAVRDGRSAERSHGGGGRSGRRGPGCGIPLHPQRSVGQRADGGGGHFRAAQDHDRIHQAGRRQHPSQAGCPRDLRGRRRDRVAPPQHGGRQRQRGRRLPARGPARVGGLPGGGRSQRRGAGARRRHSHRVAGGRTGAHPQRGYMDRRDRRGDAARHHPALLGRLPVPRLRFWLLGVDHGGGCRDAAASARLQRLSQEAQNLRQHQPGCQSQCPNVRQWAGWIDHDHDRRCSRLRPCTVLSPVPDRVAEVGVRHRPQSQPLDCGRGALGRRGRGHRRALPADPGAGDPTCSTRTSASPSTTPTTPTMRPWSASAPRPRETSCPAACPAGRSPSGWARPAR